MKQRTGSAKIFGLELINVVESEPDILLSPQIQIDVRSDSLLNQHATIVIWSSFVSVSANEQSMQNHRLSSENSHLKITKFDP